MAEQKHAGGVGGGPVPGGGCGGFGGGGLAAGGVGHGRRHDGGDISNVSGFGDVFGGVVVEGEKPDGVAGSAGIHGEISEGVGGSVLSAGHPGEFGGLEGAEDFLAFEGEFPHVGMFDLPPPGHLFDYKFGVHADADVGGPELLGDAQPVVERMVFGNIVGGGTHHVGEFPHNGGPVGFVDDGAGAGDAGVTAGAAVGFDDEFHEGFTPLFGCL